MLRAAAGALVIAVTSFARADVPAARSEGTLRWDASWPRFRAGEFVVTGAMLVGTAAIAVEDHYRAPAWQGGILFDDAVRGALVADSADGRRRAQTIGTDLYLGSFGFSLADAVVGAWAVRGSSDVMSQMLLMDSEVYALVGLLQFSAATIVRRERPYQRGCREGIDVGFPGCRADDIDSSKSFFAGHTAIAFTNAGLTCAHHQHLHLYSTALDVLACGVTTASALVVAYTRIAADKHYASDDLVGAIVGGTAGYLVPTLLHYRGPLPAVALREPLRVSAVMPLATPSYLGLALTGEF
jgi:membrane-associated phospholipid phosphatase